MIREPLIFEISDKGKRAFCLPKLDVPEQKDVLQGIPVRDEIEGFPQVSEVEIVRHFTRLSRTNFCIDIGFYPLGSCTMKYNPKINEFIAAHPGFTSSHPYASPELVQGNLKILKKTEADMIVNYLPVGSRKATRLYAQAALETECAFVNCIPEFIASDPKWSRKFEDKKLPIAGDDIKSQLGATILFEAWLSCA